MPGLARHNDFVARGYGAAADYLVTFDSFRGLTAKIVATAKTARGLEGLLWLVLDLNGVGGPAGAGAPSGRRAGLYRALGSGDWSAHDGADWRAASFALLHSCIGVELRPVVASPHAPSGVELVAEYALGRDRHGTSAFVGVTQSAEAAQYIAALARRVLWDCAWSQSLVGTPPVHEGVLRRACAVRWDVESWAVVMGDAERLISEIHV